MGIPPNRKCRDKGCKESNSGEHTWKIIKTNIEKGNSKFNLVPR